MTDASSLPSAFIHPVAPAPRGDLLNFIPVEFEGRILRVLPPSRWTLRTWTAMEDERVARFLNGVLGEQVDEVMDLEPAQLGRLLDAIGAAVRPYV